MIAITNDGARLLGTNYWSTPQAQAGYLFVSWNASCFRLLVPAAAGWMIPEMRSGHEVIITRGPWPDKNRTEALELMFEDASDSPFAVHIGVEQSDRLIPECGQGAGLAVTVYTAQGPALELPARYRIMPQLPCLEPWGTH
jgi:hypothetical protein